MQGEKRTSGPQWLAGYVKASESRLAGKRMTGRNPPVLQAAPRDTGVAEQCLTQRTASKSGYSRPWPAQRIGGNHAMRINHRPAVTMQHHFANIGQTVGLQPQSRAFVPIRLDKANASRTNREMPAALLEPVSQ